MNFIENLQNKPRYIRVQIFWISVVLIMSIIIFFWLVSLNYSLGGSKSEQEAGKESIPSLFNTLKEDFSLFKKSLQAGIKGVIEIGKEKEPDFEVEILK